MDGQLIIVQCGGCKIWKKEPDAGPTKATDAYISGYFRNNRAYAERFGTDWLILSAKYGFLDPETLIEDYNVSFLDPRTKPIDIGTLRLQVREMRLARFPFVAVLGGKKYVDMARGAFDSCPVRIHEPFRGLKGIGYMQQAAKGAIQCGRPL